MQQPVHISNYSDIDIKPICVVCEMQKSSAMQVGVVLYSLRQFCCVAFFL